MKWDLSMSIKFYDLIKVVALLVLAAHLTSVSAEDATALDKIMLKNGSVIYGTVKSAMDGVVSFDTEFAGVIEVKSSAIDSMQTQGSVTIQVTDGTIIKDKPLQIEKESFEFNNAQGELISYTVAEIKHVNPEPWQLGEGYKWFGNVSFAFELERGNSDSDELDYRVNSVWRSLENRYTVKLNGEIDKSNDVKSADNSMLVGKYDRFTSNDSYWGLNLALEQDDFEDLNLRTYLGPYYGRQWFDKPIFSMSAETGLVFVDEDFIEAEDQDYMGANWTIHATSNYFGGKSKLYADVTGIWNLDAADEVILNTTLGFSFPLLGNLEAAAEILLEYDSGAVEGVDELDQTYKIRIGYGW
jgi:hypothetical protein